MMEKITINKIATPKEAGFMCIGRRKKVKVRKKKEINEKFNIVLVKRESFEVWAETKVLYLTTSNLI